jgi:hypothetical protein
VAPKLASIRCLVRAGAVVAACAIAWACAPSFRDGSQVEGVWVGNRSWTAAECTAQPCDLMAEVARGQLLEREPNAQIREVRFHDIPRVLDNGETITSTLETWNIVFTLEDGSRRLEQFSCGIDGLVSPAANVYRRFCASRGGSSTDSP